MEVPEKIYLQEPTKVRIQKMYDNDVEYIRKDALIEWAKNMKRICQGAEPLEKAYQTIIDKLNSM